MQQVELFSHISAFDDKFSKRLLIQPDPTSSSDTNRNATSTDQNESRARPTRAALLEVVEKSWESSMRFVVVVSLLLLLFASQLLEAFASIYLKLM